MNGMDERLAMMAERTEVEFRDFLKQYADRLGVSNEGLDDIARHEAENIAQALAPLLAEWQAEAWEEGRAVERIHAKQVAEHHHWSHIGVGLPIDVPNPYRVTLDGTKRP